MPPQPEESPEPYRASGTDRENHLGRIFAIPDTWWGFEAAGREDHPGACVQELPASRDCILLKGTGAENRERYETSEVVISPTDTNGLLKNTVFSVRPRRFRIHRLKNLVPERVMGQLSHEELKRLFAAMIREFGLQG